MYILLIVAGVLIALGLILMVYDVFKKKESQTTLLFRAASVTFVLGLAAMLVFLSLYAVHIFRGSGCSGCM